MSFVRIVNNSPTTASSRIPSNRPSSVPPTVPVRMIPIAVAPTLFPSQFPTSNPSPLIPTVAPTAEPSSSPSIRPSASPSMRPSKIAPTMKPSSQPPPSLTPTTYIPTTAPSFKETSGPSIIPTGAVIQYCNLHRCPTQCNNILQFRIRSQPNLAANSDHFTNSCSFFEIYREAICSTNRQAPTKKIFQYLIYNVKLFPSHYFHLAAFFGPVRQSHQFTFRRQVHLPIYMIYFFFFLCHLASNSRSG